MKNRNISHKLITPSIFIFFTSLLLLMIAQYKTGFTGYITRFVIFTQNMLHHGMSLFPIINGNPYPDYPITGTILTYLSSLLFGKISVLSIGFPYCIAASLTLVFIYKLGAIHNKKWGIYAVLFALFTWKFVDAVHFIALDIYPALATVFCFYFVYTSKIRNDARRLWWLPIGLVFGFLTRGPIGFISPAAIIFTFYLIEKNWKHLIIYSFLSALLFVFCILLFLFAAYLQDGYRFAYNVLTTEFFGRINNEHAPRLYFYFSSGLFNYLFSIPFAIFVILKKRKDIFKFSELPKTETDAAVSEAARNKFLLYLTIWFLIILIGFTIPNTKKARYILPIIPSISLLAAYLFVDESKIFQTARAIVRKICFSMPIIGLILIFAAQIYNHFHPLSALQAYYFQSALILLILLLANILLFSRRQKSISKNLLLSAHDKKTISSITCISIGIISMLVINIMLLYPAMFHINLKQAALSVFLPL